MTTEWDQLTTAEKVERLKKSLEHWNNSVVPLQLAEIRREIDKEGEKIAELKRRLEALEGAKKP